MGAFPPVVWAFVDERLRENHVSNTSVAVVGPGAIGSTMAALLHAAGHHVLLCGHTPRDQVEVRPDDRDPIVVPGPVLTDPADVDGPVEVVLLAVKDTQNQSAAGWLGRLCDHRTVVCALQNGVEQVERVGPLCPSSEVVPAVRVVLRRAPPGGLGSAANAESGSCCRRGTARRRSRICCAAPE